MKNRAFVFAGAVALLAGSAGIAFGQAEEEGEPEELLAKRVTIQLEDATLKQFLDEIATHGVSFAGRDLDQVTGISVNLQNVELRQAIELIYPFFTGTGLEGWYDEDANLIVVTYPEEEEEGDEEGGEAGDDEGEWEGGEDETEVEVDIPLGAVEGDAAGVAVPGAIFPGE